MSKAGLQNFELFQGLDDSIMEQLLGIAKKKNYAAGEVIFNQGKAGGSLYLVEKGCVQISLLIQGLVNEYEKLAKLREGAFFGMLSLFDGRAHSTKASAVEETGLLVIAGDDLKKILRENPLHGLQLMENIILSLTGIIRGINTRYADLSSYLAT